MGQDLPLARSKNFTQLFVKYETYHVNLRCFEKFTWNKCDIGIEVLYLEHICINDIQSTYMTVNTDLKSYIASLVDG